MSEPQRKGRGRRLDNNAVSLDDFRMVRAVARARGLAGAAAALGVNSSTVFRRLARLEATLGCALFERRRGGYALTPAGEEMVAVAETMEAAAAGFLRRVEGTDPAPSGELRVTTSDGLMTPLLADILRRFRQTYPLIRLELVLDNARLNLSRRDADIAIRATDRPPETLVGRRIGRIAWAVYGRRADFPDADGATPPQPGAGVSWIGLGGELAAIRPARFVRDLAGGDDNVGFRVNTVRALAEAVSMGLGVAPLPCMCGDIRPDLVRLSQPYNDIATSLWLLTHPDLRNAPRVRAFMDFVGGELARRRRLVEGEEPDAPIRREASAP
ncbi:LysR family transcriptional regulator [Camelimonas abortus]|uniref:LysR family transcriptional regulator n=1 Tax=Camelimonas abortus TaxID=1017184 RepID=A0ABV7LGZ5_9HYPH